MKRVDSHLSRLLLCIGFFVAFAASAFGFSPLAESFQNKEGSILSSDEGSKSSFFEVPTISEVSSTIPQTETFGAGIFNSLQLHFNFVTVEISSLQYSSYYRKDRRRLIGQLLFPFHFFW
ncbi:hypothetical protein [Aequorivita echinoideorum]|uniref:hypothetical protein n=1 Tax=Aequorivita echinoideorum TaxID=1549647 RepID=UPI001BD985E6|nr:hypothetical protein [Aequorivita echinoideorum]